MVVVHREQLARFERAALLLAPPRFRSTLEDVGVLVRAGGAAVVLGARELAAKGRAQLGQLGLVGRGAAAAASLGPRAKRGRGGGGGRGGSGGGGGGRVGGGGGGARGF